MLRFVFGINVHEDGFIDVQSYNRGVPDEFILEKMRAHINMLEDEYFSNYRGTSTHVQS